MVKNIKQSSSSEVKKTYMGLRLLFVIIWPILLALFIHSNLSIGLLGSLSADDSTLLVGIILLAPIALAILPLAYRIDDIYNVSDKRVPISTWKRAVLSVGITGIVLWLPWYLFIVISFTLGE